MALRPKGAEVLVLGITFKENCPDVRNTKAVDVISALEQYNIKVTIYDPWANEEEVKHEYGLKSTRSLPIEKFDAILLTVAHDEFKELNYSELRKENSILYDVKNILNSNQVDKTL